MNQIQSANPTLDQTDKYGMRATSAPPFHQIHKIDNLPFSKEPLQTSDEANFDQVKPTRSNAISHHPNTLTKPNDVNMNQQVQLPDNTNGNTTGGEQEPPRRKNTDPQTISSSYIAPVSDQEYFQRKQIRTLSIHSWYHLDNCQQRQLSFSKSKIAFPVLNTVSSTFASSILAPERRRQILFDAQPRIVSNDISHNTWSRSIQCLLSQSCDCVFTFVCTLCYYHKVLQVIMKNKDRVITIEGNDMVVDSPTAKNTFFIACNILSMKFHDDNYLTNKFFSWNLFLPDVCIGQMLNELANCIQD